jgi:hypothetical protein
MFDPETIAQLNGEYKIPADAGPAWREAARMGMDMALLEENLKLTPWERLLRNNGFVNLARLLREGRTIPDGRPG